MKKGLIGIWNWMTEGRRLTFAVIIVILFAIVVVVSISLFVYGDKPEKDKLVNVYVTITGFGERDFENRLITVKDGDALENIFSLQYPDIYNEFGKPLVYKNNFETFLGERRTSQKSFHVMINGVFDTNLSQAYVYEGQLITIAYY